MLTSQVVRQRQEALESRYPRLRRGVARPLGERASLVTGLADLAGRADIADLADLADLAAASWRHDYGDEPRIHFSPELLATADPAASFVWEEDGEILGAIFGFPLRFRGLAATLATGLCVRPGARGSGIGQYLLWSLQEALLRRGDDLSLFWVDSRHQGPGSSARTFVRDPLSEGAHWSIPILGRSLDPLLSREAAPVSLAAYLGAQLAGLAFPSRPATDPFRVSSDGLDGRSLAAFAERSASGPFPRELRVDENGAGPVRWVLATERGEPRLLLGGLVNSWSRGRYFMAEAVVFDHLATYAAKRRALASAEAEVRDRFGCSGIIAPTTVSGEPLWKYGYLPVARQRLVHLALSERAPAPRDVRRLHVELR